MGLGHVARYEATSHLPSAACSGCSPVNLKAKFCVGTPIYVKLNQNVENPSSNTIEQVSLILTRCNCFPILLLIEQEYGVNKNTSYTNSIALARYIQQYEVLQMPVYKPKSQTNLHENTLYQLTTIVAKKSIISTSENRKVLPVVSKLTEVILGYSSLENAQRVDEFRLEFSQVWRDLDIGYLSAVVKILSKKSMLTILPEEEVFPLGEAMVYATMIKQAMSHYWISETQVAKGEKQFDLVEIVNEAIATSLDQDARKSMNTIRNMTNELQIMIGERKPSKSWLDKLEQELRRL